MSEREWWVISPEMAETVPILDDGSGPTEYGHDVVKVVAPTKREAIRRGVAAMEHWPQEARTDGINPFVGVTAELVEETDHE